MVKKAKGKQRLDKFARLAKDAGLRSRAAFKLTQLDAKFSFLSSSRAVLDLCAAPGGWAQIAVQRAPVASLVVAVDLDPIRPIRGVHTLIQDITTPKCRAAIKRLMDDNGCKAFDLVLHDGSPNMGGNWQSEATTQSALVVEALRLATQFLAAKGTFVTKIFRSQDYDAVRFCLKQLFEKVEITKPPASRSTSAEIYAICLKYKAPAKIDPRLLDMKHLFQGAVETRKVVDVLRTTKQKRHREGYDDGITVLWKDDLVSNFVWSETPLQILASLYTLTFEDPACLPIKDHELTTEEIKSLCEDLRVLDKNDFKHLLKWRMRIRKALSSDQKIAPKAANADPEAKPDGDDSLLNEMEELKNVLERKNKREKKIIAKRRAKDKLRKATGMQIDATDDSYNDHDLFSLSQMKGKKDLLAISSAEANNEDYGDLGDSDIDDPDAFVDRYVSASDMDSDEEHKRYDDQLDEMLDHAYERYLTRKGGRNKTSKRIKRVISDDTELLDGVDDEDIIHQDHDSDQDQSDKEANPLVVPLQEDDQPTEEQKENKWYSQDVFIEAVDEGVFEKSDSEDEEKEPSFEVSKKSARLEKSVSEDEEKEPSLEVSKKSDRPVTLLRKDSKSLTTKAMQQEEFEVVPEEPMQSSDDDSSSDESEDLDEDQKAEVLAFAKKMLRKKQREQIIDDAYNKYMYDDENLPNWFAHEEKRHWQAIKPVTKEEVAAMKAQFREIDTRPIKKVAEAKARKKRSAMKKLEKVRHKADTISDQTDLPERSKRKMIDQLYKKAIPKRPKKEYVVAKKGVHVKPGKGKVLVDRRMKKDARSQGMGRTGKGGAKKAKGAKAKGNCAKRKGSASQGGKGGGRK